MRNSKRETIFRFKQFSLSNNDSAMKVSTDGVLLGAWCPPVNGHVWDVGAGTGLIALMLAQRGAQGVSAVEIAPLAAKEAMKNVSASPWPDRINTICGDICDVCGILPRPDLIVSNPPYFVSSLKPADGARSLARHEGSLTYDSLIAIASHYLTDEGRLCMVSPADRRADIEWSTALHRLYVRRMTSVSTIEGKDPTRMLWEFGRTPAKLLEDSLAIRREAGDKSGEYTEEYMDLTRDFYLNF